MRQCLQNFSVAVILVLILVLASFTVAAAAAEVTGTFELANRLYEQGHYSEAAAPYQKLVESGNISPAVYFNLGNALFKSGQIGKAIISYRLAERMKPRDPDIRANLRFALDSRNAVASPRAWWTKVLRALSLNELALLFTVAYWTWISLLVLRLVQPKGWSPPFVKTAGLVASVFGLWLFLVSMDTFKSKAGVVVVPEAVVRYGPLEVSQTYYTLQDGTELTLLGQKDEWWQVRDSQGRTGWVRMGQVLPTAPESLHASKPASQSES